jgi:hypothetical protein
MDRVGRCRRRIDRQGREPIAPRWDALTEVGQNALGRSNCCHSLASQRMPGLSPNYRMLQFAPRSEHHSKLSFEGSLLRLSHWC